MLYTDGGSTVAPSGGGGSGGSGGSGSGGSGSGGGSKTSFMSLLCQIVAC